MRERGTEAAPEHSYVAGFLFSENREFVVLITKDHPEWQAGKLNAVGGKIQYSDENPAAAMRREFAEEAWLDIRDWSLKVHLKGPGWEVYFFAAFAPPDVVEVVRAREKEQVHAYRVDAIDGLEVIPNLRWLVPLCLDPDIEVAQVSDSTKPGEGRTRA